MDSEHNHSENDDKLWVDYINHGDEKAFELLFKKYYEPLTRFAWRYVNSKAVSEELVQEVFTIMWENTTDWDTEKGSSIRPYLYKSVKNLALNYLKHQGVRDNYDKEWMEQKETPGIEYRDTYREERIRDAITTAIEELPERCKMTYKLHRHDGLTYQEISVVMDVSVKTVESQMTRTLRILRERLAYLLPYFAVAVAAI